MRIVSLGTARYNAMSLQPDGKLLIGGDLFFIEGGTLHDVGRLYADGTPDPTFDPGPVIHTLEDEGVLALASNPTARSFLAAPFTSTRTAVGPDWPDSTPMARSTTVSWRTSTALRCGPSSSFRTAAFWREATAFSLPQLRPRPV